MYYYLRFAVPLILVVGVVWYLAAGAPLAWLPLAICLLVATVLLRIKLLRSITERYRRKTPPPTTRP
jgi:hypothetical protein